MKAIVFRKYGSPAVLELAEVARPTPKDNEVLIRIHAATVTAGDCEIRCFDVKFLFWLPLRVFFGITKPKKHKQILGQELAGEIEAFGKDVTRFKKGDKVFAVTGAGFGAYAEYRCMPEDGKLAIMPANMSYEEAATIPTGGFNALHFLRTADIRSGQKILIYGAAGSIGTLAIQLAKHFGAEVTGLDSTAKLDMLRSIGADHVIDYTKEDFSRSGVTYDVIFDVVGKSPYSRSTRSLAKNGVYLLANPGLPQMLRGLWTSLTSGKKVVMGLAGESVEDLIFFRELIEAGTLKTVIDKRYPLEQMADAHRYVESGQKAGNVVINVAPVNN